MPDSKQLEYFNSVYYAQRSFQEGKTDTPPVAPPASNKEATLIWNRALACLAERSASASQEEYENYVVWHGYIVKDEGTKKPHPDYKSAYLDDNNDGNLDSKAGFWGDARNIKPETMESYTAAIAYANAVSRILEKMQAGKRYTAADAAFSVTEAENILAKDHGSDYANKEFRHFYKDEKTITGRITKRINDAMGDGTELPNSTDFVAPSLQAAASAKAPATKQDISKGNVLSLAYQELFGQLPGSQAFISANLQQNVKTIIQPYNNFAFLPPEGRLKIEQAMHKQYQDALGQNNSAGANDIKHGMAILRRSAEIQDLKAAGETKIDAIMDVKAFQEYERTAFAAYGAGKGTSPAAPPVTPVTPAAPTASGKQTDISKGNVLSLAYQELFGQIGKQKTGTTQFIAPRFSADVNVIIEPYKNFAASNLQQRLKIEQQLHTEYQDAVKGKNPAKAEAVKHTMAILRRSAEIKDLQDKGATTIDVIADAKAFQDYERTAFAAYAPANAAPVKPAVSVKQTDIATGDVRTLAYQELFGDLPDSTQLIAPKLGKSLLPKLRKDIVDIVNKQPSFATSPDQRAKIEQDMLQQYKDANAKGDEYGAATVVHAMAILRRSAEMADLRAKGVTKIDAITDFTKYERDVFIAYAAKPVSPKVPVQPATPPVSDAPAASDDVPTPAEPAPVDPKKPAKPADSKDPADDAKAPGAAADPVDPADPAAKPEPKKKLGKNRWPQQAPSDELLPSDRAAFDDDLIGFITRKAPMGDKEPGILWRGSHSVYDAKLSAEENEARREYYGARIKDLEVSLMRTGHTLKEKDDAVYGAEVEREVKIVQAKYGLRQDGVAGFKTIAALQVEELKLIASDDKSTTEEILHEINDVIKLQEVKKLPAKVQKELDGIVACLEEKVTATPNDALTQAIASIKPKEKAPPSK